MRQVLSLGNEFVARVAQETEMMLVERIALRDIVEGRLKELEETREQELRRIDELAKAQRDHVNEVFSAMLTENEIDRRRHEEAIKYLMGEGSSPVLMSLPSNTGRYQISKAAE